MPTMRALASVWLAAPLLLAGAIADGRATVSEGAELPVWPAAPAAAPPLSPAVAPPLLPAAAPAAAPAASPTALGYAPKDSPVGKVAQLLGELGSQLQDDKVADGQQFQKYMTWYQGESTSATTLITDTKQSLQSLGSELKQEEAFRQAQDLVVQKAIADLAKVEKELQNVTTQRGVEHKAFVDNEAQVDKGIQQLGHALTVMGQSPSPAQATPQSGVTLLDVAKKVKTLLLQGSDFHLTLAQRETLDGFMRAAVRRSRSAANGGLRGAPGDEVLAPDFLQVNDLASPYGQYQTQSSGVATVLQNVLDKAKKQLDDLRATEQKQSSDFQVLEQDLKKQVTTVKGTLSNAKQQIAASEELSGKRKADLLAAQEVLKVTEDGLAKLEADFVAKNTSFHERTLKRDDEILAVQEASDIMNSTEMQKLMGAQYASSPALLQIHQVSRRNALHMLRRANSPAVALLALRTQTRSMRSTSQADPFAKVTDLLKDMIKRLSKEYAEEATKAQYCETEMAKSAKSKFNIEKSADKLKARIAQIDTEVDQLVADIKRIETEIQDMSKARADATTLRASEKSEALNSIVRYKDAQRLLKSALVVLRKTYGKKVSSGGGGGTSGGYKVSGIGAGVVGLLEIAVEDFAQLQTETETAEATAEKDYKELMDSTEIKTATFNKDLEYKNREKVRLEGDRMRNVEDLQNFDKELAALKKYVEQLKVQCPKGETYQERKTRREEEIRQLQEALTHLTNTP